MIIEILTWGCSSMAERYTPMPQLDRLSLIDGPAVVGYRLRIERLQVRILSPPHSRILDFGFVILDCNVRLANAIQNLKSAIKNHDAGVV